MSASPHDIDARRSTYSFIYPVDIITLNSKKDYLIKFTQKPGKRYSVEYKQVHVDYKNGTIIDCTFSFSRFNVYQNSIEISSLVEKMTFRSCYFNKCFLGSTTFKEVRFENCNFEDCDFMNSRFIDCTFDLSIFKNCSANHAYFHNTEIPTLEFFKSYKFLEDNFKRDGATKELTSTRRREYIYNTTTLAKSIYRSNSNASNSSNIDDSLYQLKKAELALLKDQFSHPNERFECCREPFYKNIWSRRKFCIPIIFRSINLFLTRGGTSLSRLIVAAFVIISLFTLVFYNLNPQTASDQIHYLSEVQSITLWLLKTTSIFLGIGYGSFTFKTNLELVALVSCASVGLFWYALLIPVLLRKIYK